jgi:hypothetical protein
MTASPGTVITHLKPRLTRWVQGLTVIVTRLLGRLYDWDLAGTATGHQFFSLLGVRLRSRSRGRVRTVPFTMQSTATA